MMQQRSLISVVLAAGFLIALGGCETATSYRPAVRAGAEVYHEVRIESDRWRVTFLGNDLTSRETVENYLLYRAAELTVQSGDDWFRAVTRNVDAKHSTYVDQPSAAGGYGLIWRPYWRFRHQSFYPGWQTWDPWGPTPFVVIHTVTTYEASAEIVMGKGDKPVGPDYFGARAVIDALGPSISRPR